MDKLNNDDFVGESSGSSKSFYTGTLDRRNHVEELIAGLTGELPKSFENIVPAQTWTVYWIAHSLSLLEQPQFLDTITQDVIDFIKECAHKDGGYGGGPGQIGHLACTFAAVNALIAISSEEALDSIDRVSLVRFLHRMKQPNGSFTMHDDGEIDSRASYCVLAITKCLNIQDSILFENVAEWLLTCQTYEGGFASVPGSEAHGGYTFCCVASLCLLNQLHRADIGALLRWLVNKQLTADGGFCGRSNKSVDSCYSYWQGATFHLLHPFLKKLRTTLSSTDDNRRTTRSSTARTGPTRSRRTSRSSREDLNETSLDKLLDNWLFDCAALQDYILNKCQSEGGLLRDKPETEPDFYHTCYALSGLSLSQHQPDEYTFDIGSKPINLIGQTHPLFNSSLSSLRYCLEYFRNKKIETFEDGHEKEGEEKEEELLLPKLQRQRPSSSDPLINKP